MNFAELASNKRMEKSLKKLNKAIKAQDCVDKITRKKLLALSLACCGAGCLAIGGGYYEIALACMDASLLTAVFTYVTLFDLSKDEMVRIMVGNGAVSEDVNKEELKEVLTAHKDNYENLLSNRNTLDKETIKNKENKLALETSAKVAELAR